jgi:aminotransferase
MKSPLFSTRVDAIEPPKIKIDFAQVRKPGVISLSIGEPDFETPWEIKQAGIEAIQNGYTFYADDSGLPKLRGEICAYVKRRYGLDYDSNGEVLVSVGASEAIDLTFRAFLNEGDEVIIPQPAYNSYGPLVSLMGGKVVGVPLLEEHAFRLQASDLEKAITPASKLLVLNYPHNPTGAIMEKADLEPIVEVCKKHNLYVVSDEIYSELTYGKKHVSIAALPGMKERTVYISGFSKAFAMTGWRLGYICAPKDAIAHLRKIHQYGSLAAPTISQYAALEALKNGQEETEKMKRAYDERRRYLIKALKEMNLDCFAPEGAFYVFPCIKKTGLSSEEFINRLFSEEKLLFISGTAFGPLGEGYVRISYAYSLDKLKEGMARLAHFLSKYRS